MQSTHCLQVVQVTGGRKCINTAFALFLWLSVPAKSWGAELRHSGTATFQSPSVACPWAAKRPAKRAMGYVARTLNILFYHRLYSSSIRDLLLWLHLASRNRLFFWLYVYIWRAVLLISRFDGLHSCGRHASWVYAESTHHICAEENKTLEATFPIALRDRLCFCVRANFLHVAFKCCTEITV